MKKFLDDQVVPTMILPPDEDEQEEATEETPLDEEAIAGRGAPERARPPLADPFAETAFAPDGRGAPWTAPMPGLEDQGIGEAKTTILESARLPEAPRMGAAQPPAAQPPAAGPPPWTVAPQAQTPVWMQQGAARPAGAGPQPPARKPAGNRTLVVMLVAFAVAALGLGALALVAWSIALR